MRLLYILPEFPPDSGGGIATVYGQLLPVLASRGHQITVVLANQHQLDAATREWNGITIVSISSEHVACARQELAGWTHHAFIHQFLPLAWAAWRQATSLGPFDLVEATDWGMLALPWLAHPHRQPVVVALHGSCGQVDWYGNPNARSGEGALVRLLESAAFSLADGLLANSNRNAQFWWQECGRRPHVIPPLLPVTADRESPPQATSRSGMGLVIGRFQNWKGPELLCQALQQLPDQQIDWVGADTQWQDTTQTAFEHLQALYPDILQQQLHLLGSLEPVQVKEMIGKASFVCIPSYWDVFNVTALEAIAEGTPVICSRAAGAEMLISHGHSGYLFSPDHPEELVAAIQAVTALSPAERRALATRASSAARGASSPARIGAAHEQWHAQVLAEYQERQAPLWLSKALKGPAPQGRSGLRTRALALLRRLRS